jgi:uncharacterized membrane protein
MTILRGDIGFSVAGILDHAAPVVYCILSSMALFTGTKVILPVASNFLTR